MLSLTINGTEYKVEETTAGKAMVYRIHDNKGSYLFSIQAEEDQDLGLRWVSMEGTHQDLAELIGEEIERMER